MELISLVLLLVAGVLLLYVGAESLVRGAGRLGTSLGMTPIVVGLTIVSMGTSAPELVVGILATLRGSADLTMGNVLGSNLANVGLILGLTATIRPVEITTRVVSREIPVMLAVTLLLYPLILDLELDWGNGTVLLATLVAYLIFVVRSSRGESPEVLSKYEQFADKSDRLAIKPLAINIALVLAGGLGLMAGGRLIVESAVDLADLFGISERVVGLSVVAVGTSLPELATSVVAAARGEDDIAVGNIIGSNVFNIAAVLGVVGLIRPTIVSTSVLSAEFPAVLIISALLLPLALRRRVIGRGGGVLLLLVYFTLCLWVFS